MLGLIASTITIVLFMFVSFFLGASFQKKLENKRKGKITQALPDYEDIHLLIDKVKIVENSSRKSIIIIVDKESGAIITSSMNAQDAADEIHRKASFSDTTYINTTLGEFKERVEASLDRRRKELEAQVENLDRLQLGS